MLGWAFGDIPAFDLPMTVTLKLDYGFTLRTVPLKALLTPVNGESPDSKGNQSFCKLWLHYICCDLLPRPNVLKRNSLCSLRVSSD